MHLKPAEGMPRPVGRAIVDHLFPEAESVEKYGRIPIVGVAGTRGTNTIARLVAWLLHLSGPKVGLACRDGLFLDRKRVERGDCAHWEPAHRLLMNRAVEAAVFENGAKTILRDGLVYDRCQVGVVTDLERAAELAEFDVLEDEQMYKVMRTQVDVVLADGAAVLNVDDERLVEMAELCDGEVIFYGQDGEHPTLQAHTEAGKRAVFLRRGFVVLATGPNVETLSELGEIAHWLVHTGADSADTLLAAIAAAWGMNLSADLITAGIETFDPGLQAPRGLQPSAAKLH
jgi:cyanophycin synthetase